MVVPEHERNNVPSLATIPALRTVQLTQKNRETHFDAAQKTKHRHSEYTCAYLLVPTEYDALFIS